MKILGKTKLKRRTKKVQIGQTEDGQPVIITLHAPRLSFVNGLEALLSPPDEPEAPSTGVVLRDARGQIVKDDSERPIVGKNYEDPGYKKLLKAHELVTDKFDRAQSMAVILECCDESELELSIKVSDFSNGQGGPGKSGALVDYYTLAWLEFEEANIDMVALSKLTEAAGELSAIKDEETDTAREALVGSGEGN